MKRTKPRMLLQAVAVSTTAALMGCATAETPAPQMATSAVVEQTPVVVDETMEQEVVPAVAVSEVPERVAQRVGNTKAYDPAMDEQQAAASLAAVQAEPVPDKIACRIGNTKRVPSLTPEECAEAKATFAERRARRAAEAATRN